MSDEGLKSNLGRRRVALSDIQSHSLRVSSFDDSLLLKRQWRFGRSKNNARNYRMNILKKSAIVSSIDENPTEEDGEARYATSDIWHKLNA